MSIGKDEWERRKNSLSVGQLVIGVVVHHATFGVFVDLGEGLLGLIEVFEMPGGKEITTDDYPKLGSTVPAQVLGFKDHDREVILSMKRTPERDTG